MYHIFIHSSVNGQRSIRLLLPCLGYCKQCCNEYWGACILSEHGFLWIYAKWDCRVCFLRNLHIVLHSGCTIYRVGGFPSLHTLLLFVDFFMKATLTSVKWYLILVLICLSLIISNAEHLLMCLLALCMFSLEKCLFGLLTICWLGCLFWCCWAWWAVCKFWRQIPCGSRHFQIFSPNPWVVLLFCLLFPLLCKTFWI